MKIKLREVREKANMTQSILADFCGITQASISQIENQERMPSVEVVEKIAKALNIEKIYLFENGYKDFLKFYLNDLVVDLSIKSIERLTEYAELLIMAELQQGGLDNLKIVVDKARGGFANSPPMQGY